MNSRSTITHKIGYLYLAFAHQTDGVYAQAEQIVLWKNVQDWTEITLTKAEFAQIMDDVMRKYRLDIAEDVVMEQVLEIAKELNLMPDFDYNHRLQALCDLQQIASADKNFIEREAEWIQTLGEIWDVKKSDIKRICSQSSK